MSAAPQPFDPVAFIADMRQAGAALYPFGERQFGIAAQDGRGLPGNVLWVGDRWAPAARLHPDWIGAVHDALTGERT